MLGLFPSLEILKMANDKKSQELQMLSLMALWDITLNVTSQDLEQGFNGIWLYDTSNTFYLILRGLKNALFIPFTPPLYRHPTILWQSSSKQYYEKEELGILEVGWKWLFIV